MNTKPSKTQKVRVTLAITKQAQDTMLDHGYCSVRGMGDFVSRLIMEHHARMVGVDPVRQALAQELRRLADKLDYHEL